MRAERSLQMVWRAVSRSLAASELKNSRTGLFSQSRRALRSRLSCRASCRSGSSSSAARNRRKALQWWLSKISCNTCRLGNRRFGHDRRPESEALLRGNAIGAFAVIALEGSDLQTHFALHCAAQEPPHRVGLPFGGLHQFGQGSAIRATQQLQDF